MSVIWPPTPANTSVALSQDFQAALGVPVTLVGSGGGGGSTNPSFSTISMPAGGSGSGRILWSSTAFIEAPSDTTLNLVGDSGITLTAGGGSACVKIFNQGADLGGDLSVLNILNVSTINGSPYTVGGISIDPVVNTIGVTVSATISSILGVSSINGAPYAPGGGGSYPAIASFSTINLPQNTPGSETGLIQWDGATSIASLAEGVITLRGTNGITADCGSAGTGFSIISGGGPAFGDLNVRNILNVSTINGTDWTALVSTVAGLSP
jgi:hypothetical protein